MRPVLSTALLAAGLLGIGTMTACGSGATPTPNTSAPTITADPLNMSRYVSGPCAMLRADQLAQYHLVAPGMTSSDGSGAACRWTAAPTTLPSYTGRADPRSGGLTALYARRPSIPVFRPTMISNYPAVNTANSADVTQHGQCTVQVGVAPGTLLVVDVTVPAVQALDYTDPCPDANALAAAIIANSVGQVP
jgi:hypothetical protein